jgi:hypothetical protein
MCILSGVHKVLVNPIIQSKTPSIVTKTRENIMPKNLAGIFKIWPCSVLILQLQL